MRDLSPQGAGSFLFNYSAAALPPPGLEEEEMSGNKEEYEKSQLYRIRHSTAHVMAEAVLEKFPTGRVAIGPPIEDGFYYDFDLPRTLTPEDLAEIEERMKQLISQKEQFSCEEISRRTKAVRRAAIQAGIDRRAGARRVG